jgi:hypothetical protein
MNTKNSLLYKKYYLDNNNESLDLFKSLAEKFMVESALYPGSFVHVTPSFIFPEVTYIDNDKRAKSFFGDPEITEYISEHKLYKNDPTITFLPEDYRESSLTLLEHFDLLISLYAGIISKYCTRYLKVNGFLLVNNSHGDAGMASINERYELLGVFNKKGNRFTFSNSDLDSYFIPKKEVIITEEYLEGIGRGIGYTKSSASYLFKKIY